MKDSKIITSIEPPLNLKENGNKSKEEQESRNSKTEGLLNQANQDNPIIKEQEKSIIELQNEINLLQDKIDVTKNEIHLLTQKLLAIPQNYSRPIVEIEKKKIEDHIKIENNNKDELESLLEIKRNELNLKNEEIRLGRIENSQAKYDKYMSEQKMNLENARKDLDIANQSLTSRDLFYEKEIYELTKAENSIRELLSNLWRESEIQTSSLEIQLENLKKDLNLYNLLYENKLIEIRTKSLTKENLDELELLHEKVRKIEEEIHILDAKRIEETIYSPSKKLASLKYEEQLVLIY